MNIPATADLPQLLANLELLPSAAVSDALDRLGHREQAMSSRIHAIFPSACLAGFARTVEAVPVSQVPTAESLYYKQHLEFTESLRFGDVIVMSPIDSCMWGELLSVAAKARGARGIVIDGFVRDSAALEELDFRAFSLGTHPADPLGRADLGAVDVEIHCGNVRVRPRDIVIADRDGVVVIPSELLSDVVRIATEKLRVEAIVRPRLATAMSVYEALASHQL